MRVFWIFAIAVALCATATGEEAEGEEDATIEVEKAEVNQVEEAVITDKTPFIATSEWQKIKQGQAIPPGLHVRMNLQTGEREAKILDPEENDARKTSDNSALSMNPSNVSNLVISTGQNISAATQHNIVLHLPGKNNTHY